MECLKVELYTPTGIFKNPFSLKGVEVFPLPPYSTIIGLVYQATGRKWQGERFQISVQGSYESIFRDYIWFKKYNMGDKKLEKLPLQVPILYSTKLIIHIKAKKNLMDEIEQSFLKPKKLLFLSGGEYPVKIRRVKRVICESKSVQEEEPEELKGNAYIPEELFKSISATGEAIYYKLSHFYSSEKKKAYQWIGAYYLSSGAYVYGSLIFDDEGDLVWLTPLESESGVQEEQETIKFYADNWLMASACVGLLEVLKHAKKNIEGLVEGKTLKIPKDLWEELKEIYADYLLKDGEEILKNSREDIKNPYNSIILSKLGDFHNNSPFTNQSKKYINRLSGKFSSENIEEALQEVRKSFLEACEKFFSQRSKASGMGKCAFCRERDGENFIGEVHFTPLFASPKKRRNFFWDNIPVCKECEFLLYFTSVGFYRSQNKYIFTYLPGDLLETYRLKSALSSKVEKDKLGLLWNVVEHAISQEKQKSKWSLQNIYFVEIEKRGNNAANIYSFHIHPRVANAIEKYIKSYPKQTGDIFSEFLFYVYTGRSLYEFLFLLLSGFVKKESFEKLEGETMEGRIISAGKKLKELNKNLLFFINFQEVLDMKQENFEKTIKWAYGEGKKLKEAYNQTYGEGLDEKTEKRIKTLTYKLLEAVRRKNIDQFAQNLIRAYLDVEREIPYVFMDVLKEESFNRIAYAFLLGLNGELKKDEGGSESSSE